MRKLLTVLLLSLAIEVRASDQYIYPPGDDSPVQHWVYPSVLAMNTDTGFYGQDAFKIAFNKGDGQFYYLSDPYGPTWLPFGGGVSTFLGLTDTPDDYGGSGGKYVAVKSDGTGLEFVVATGGSGNVSSTGTIVATQVPIWTDTTHIKGVTPLTGGTTGQVLKKDTAADYAWSWGTIASGVTTFLGLTDVPSSYAGAGGKVVAVNPGATGLEFITGGGGGNVSTTGTPATDQTAVWTDSTHIKGERTLKGGTGGQVLTKTTGTDYDWGWATAPGGGGGGTVTNIATTSPILGGPITVTGTISLDSTKITLWDKAMQWDGGATGLVAATGRSSLGLVIGTNVEAWDADLDQLAALTGTNSIYYRTGVGWSAVSMGSNMTFSGGVLQSTASGGGGGTVTNISTAAPIEGGPITTTGMISLNATSKANWDTAYTDRMKWDTSTGLAGSGTALQGRTALGAGDVTGPASSTALQLPLYNDTTGKVLRVYGGSGLVSVASGVVSTVTDNSANWNTAFTQTREWDGGATGLVAATGRTSLALNNVTNDAQTKAAVVANVEPTAAGQILVANAAAGTFTTRTLTGVAPMTATLSATGGLALDAIPNASLQFSSITITNDVVALGGTVTLDQVLGVGGTAIGVLQHTAANTLAVVAPGASGNVLTSNGSAWTSALPSGPDSVKVVHIGVSGSYTTPAGVKALYIEGVGGGGGGGGISCATGGSAYGGGSGGGGGGGYAATYVSAPAASYVITVGGGGGGAAAGNNNGGAGGNTSVGTVLTAGGGGGGGAGNGGFYMGAFTANGGNGGAGTVGTLLGNGNDGGPGVSSIYLFTAPSSFAAIGIGGYGGGSMFGGGARPLQAVSNGNPGALWGGGGSGASVAQGNARGGGAGGQGVVRIWEVY